jgi:hypothetical protein
MGWAWVSPILPLTRHFYQLKAYLIQGFLALLAFVAILKISSSNKVYDLCDWLSNAGNDIANTQRLCFFELMGEVLSLQLIEVLLLDLKGIARVGCHKQEVHPVPGRAFADKTFKTGFKKLHVEAQTIVRVQAVPIVPSQLGITTTLTVVVPAGISMVGLTYPAMHPES